MKMVLTLVLAVLMVASSVVAFASCSKDPISIGVQTGTTGQYFVDGDADWGFDGIAGYAS